MLNVLASIALAQTAPVPSNLAVSSVGVQSWSDSAMRGYGSTDVDIVLGQRLRWTLLGDLAAPGPDLVALVDARFTVDPAGGPTFEWSQVRQLGVELTAGRWTFDVGRSSVYRGGPRLVDGVQALFRAGDVTVGVWGGLVPDLFSSLPRIRPGAGPILAYSTSSTQASVVGEVASFEGELDRVAVLAQSRQSFERKLDVSTRLDVEIVGQDGARLVDGMLAVGADPSPSVHVGALYDAFSSYTYNRSEALDPDLQRFADRLGDLGASLGLTQDLRDPTLYHLFGLTGRFRPTGDGPRPVALLDARLRHHPEPERRYARLHPQLGATGLLGGALDLRLDGNWIAVETGTPCDRDVGEPEPEQGCGQMDGGVLLYLEPGDSGLAFDASARLISAPDDLPGLGWYGDLYVNLVSRKLDLLVVAGGMVTSETDPWVDDQRSVGIGVFGRVSKYLR